MRNVNFLVFEFRVTILERFICKMLLYRCEQISQGVFHLLWNQESRESSERGLTAMLDDSFAIAGRLSRCKWHAFSRRQYLGVTKYMMRKKRFSSIIRRFWNDEKADCLFLCICLMAGILTAVAESTMTDAESLLSKGRALINEGRVMKMQFRWLRRPQTRDMRMHRISLDYAMP
jgi:hypothetical protein